MKEHKEDMEELLSQYLDEELDDESTKYVRQKLASDPEWQRTLEELQITVQAIRELPNEATPERELWPEIVEARSAAAPVVVAQEAKRRFWTTPKLLAAGLTALLVPAAGLSMARAWRGYDEPVVVTVEAPRAPIVIDIQRIAEQARRAAERAIRAQERELRAQERALRGLERSERSRLQANALEAVITLLNDQDPEVRVQAVHALGEFESPRAVEALGRVLINDPEPEVQKMAAWALGEIESAAAVDFLGAALVNEDMNPEVRNMCAWALGEIESAQAVQYLAQVLNDGRSNAEVRKTSAWALGEIESAEAVDALGRALLTDTDSEVQSTAAWALGEIESAAAVDHLVRALRNDNAEVRKQAARALGEIESAAALEGLTAAIENEKDAEVRQMLIWAIGEIGN